MMKPIHWWANGFVSGNLLVMLVVYFHVSVPTKSGLILLAVILAIQCVNIATWMRSSPLNAAMDS